MPVIVIGADTPTGTAVVEALRPRESELRAFVTDPSVGADLKSSGLKVAIGDVSDGSHVGGAALGCFGAVPIAEALFDGRERSFADSPIAALQAWADAISEAEVTRLIWVADERIPEAPEILSGVAPEFAVVTSDSDLAHIAAEVARLDDLESLA